MESISLFPDEELCCDASDGSDLESSVVSSDHAEHGRESHDVWYDSFFKDTSNGGFQSIFPNVSFVEAEEEMDALLSQAAIEYPLLSPEYLHEKRAQAEERKQPHHPSGDPSAASVDHIATCTVNEEEEEKKKQLSSHPSNSPDSGPHRKELPQNWKVFLRQEYTRGILLPCPPETGNRAFFVEKHKNLRCSHTPDGKLDFRVLYDHINPTGWVFPITVDESVLSALKTMYPGWRAITWEDVEIATSTKKRHSNAEEGSVSNVPAHDISSTLSACNDSPTGGATATRSGSEREDDPPPPSPLSGVASSTMSKWAAAAQESPERFLRALEAAGGLEEAIFVCVDVETACSIKNGVAFPLEISCVPFTFSSKHKDFAPLLQYVEKKYFPPKRPNKTKEGEESSNTSLQEDTAVEQERTDTVPSTQTTSLSSSSAPCGENKRWEANICPAESNGGKQHMLKGEFHCFISSGYPEPAYYEQACYTSLRLHGIPFDASFLRKDYIAIRKELDVFFQNPSCIFLAKGGERSPPVTDIQGIRFVYAAADAVEAKKENQTVEQNQESVRETPAGESHSTSIVSPPLYVDQMRFFNSVMVQEIVSQMFCDDSNPTDDRTYRLPDHWEDDDPPTEIKEAVKVDGERKKEKSVEEITTEKEENRDVYVRYLQCWYHHKVKRVGCNDSSEDLKFHCARKDAWWLAEHAEKCLYEALLRKEKRKKKLSIKNKQ